MAARSYTGQPALAGTIRFFVGIAIVAAVGAIAQSHLVVTGPEIPWPNAALWAAAGWGLSGLGLRPLLALIVFGLASDVIRTAPFGVHVLVNLVAFGTASFLSARDRDGGDVRSMLNGLLAIMAGFATLYLLAAIQAEAAPHLLPQLGDLGATLILFLLVFAAFRLPDQDHMFRGR